MAGQCRASRVLSSGPILTQCWLSIIISALDQQRSNIRYYYFWSKVGPTVIYVQCIYVSDEENYKSAFLLSLTTFDRFPFYFYFHTHLICFSNFYFYTVVMFHEVQQVENVMFFQASLVTYTYHIVSKQQ